jgi:hypothetical protein
VQETIGVGQGATQLMQRLAQVGAGLGLAGVRPEEKREVLAQLRGVPMQDQVGEQRMQAWSVDAGDRLITVDQAEITKQLYMQRRLHRPASILTIRVVLWL